jgi:hypothetical protein
VMVTPGAASGGVEPQFHVFVPSHFFRSMPSPKYSVLPTPWKYEVGDGRERTNASAPRQREFVRQLDVLPGDERTGAAAVETLESRLRRVAQRISIGVDSVRAIDENRSESRLLN